MEVLFQAKFYNDKTTYFILFSILIIVLLTFSSKIISFFYHIQDNIKSNHGSEAAHKIQKADCVILLRVLLAIILAIMLYSYAIQLIPVMKYFQTGECLQVEGIVENYDSTRYNDVVIGECFIVGEDYFEVNGDDVQLTYAGGLISDGMHVIIDYYFDGSVNQILKITLLY
jgi:hypothetical protein